MRRLRLLLRPWLRIPLAVLAVVPVPGLGCVVVGHMNPHTGLRRNGWLQMLLVVFGSYPLFVPGAIGLGWAVVDAIRISQAELVPLPPKAPRQTPGPPSPPAS